MNKILAAVCVVIIFVTITVTGAYLDIRRKEISSIDKQQQARIAMLEKQAKSDSVKASLYEHVLIKMLENKDTCRCNYDDDKGNRGY